MTRKHFIAIAQAIHEAGLTPEATKKLAEVIGNALRSTNPRFDFDRFVSAATKGGK